MTQEEREEIKKVIEKVYMTCPYDQVQELIIEMVIEKVKANDIDYVKRIIKKMYDNGYKLGMEAAWPWVLVDVDGQHIIDSVFGNDYPYLLTEDVAVCLFKNDCDKEVEYIIESMVRPGDEEDDKNEELDAAISEYLATVHLRNRYTGDDFYLDANRQLHRTKYQLEKRKMTKKKQTDRPVDDSESYDLPF